MAEGRADIAALDAVTHALLLDAEPAMRALKVVGATDPTPGLPYIAAKGADAVAIFDAVAAAIAGLSPADRATLHLKGLTRIPTSAYLAVPNPPSPDQLALRN